MNPTYLEAMAALRAGRDLDPAQAEAVMELLMTGALADAQVAALLTALHLKGEGAAEIAAFAAVMRRHMLRVDGPDELLDTCGTGGSGLSTANTSTMTAFVLAAAGVAVAKHGNRSASGRCGSMDVLEQLGVTIELGPEAASTLLARQGLCLMYAPRFHPAMRHVGPVRRQLGFRTVFNLLGPLCNPAGARRQLLGLSDPRRADAMAAALVRLGTRRALLVHGEDGLDELSLGAPTRLWWVEPGGVRTERIAPEDLGLRRVEMTELDGGDAPTNAALFEQVLRGRGPQARADHLALNAGAALVVAGRAEGLGAGLSQARALIDSGVGWQRFVAYRQASQALAQGAA